MMKNKYPWITALIISLASLAVGASFHGLRMHPENIEKYNIGVTMGITMASVALVSVVAFIILIVLWKKKDK